MSGDYITVNYLATFAGMVMIVGLIVQFTKSLIKRTFSSQAVRLYAFLVALVIVLLVNWYNGAFSGEASAVAIQLLLSVINAIMVTLAAFGGYEVITNPRVEK